MTICIINILEAQKLSGLVTGYMGSRSPTLGRPYVERANPAGSHQWHWKGMYKMTPLYRIYVPSKTKN